MQQVLLILLISQLVVVLSFISHNSFSLRSYSTNLEVKVSKQGKPKRDRKSKTITKNTNKPEVKVIATRNKGSSTKGFSSSSGSGFGGTNTAIINNDASLISEEDVEEEVIPDHLNSINIPSDNECPCGSKLLHKDCCEKHLSLSSTTTAAALVRARFTAYKTSNLDYIIDTTHSDSSDRTYYYENIEGGHGGAANNPQTAYLWTLVFMFLRKKLLLNSSDS